MTIIYFILAALALGFLVLIHELGHLLAAKCVGMAVESFSIGFGPALYKKKIGKIEYRLGVLPFGGYVRIKGMDKGDANKDVEPVSVYDIPQGFFNKSPWKRIFVLAAGPLANVLFALLAFGLLHISGGRIKAFSEYSHIVGWVNPVLQEKGLRPGDKIITCNGQRYLSDKDMLTAALLDKSLSLQGVHPAYLDEKQEHFTLDTPFNMSVEGIPCAGASYLLYRGQELMMKDSPMANAGLRAGDRLVWMDGQLLFSPLQVSQMLNEGYAFVKVQRNRDQELFFRIPRVFANTLLLSPYVRNELIDSQYEAGLRGKWSSLYTLPYVINSYGYVEGELKPIDPNSPFPKSKDKLELGDRIIAIDGIPVYGSTDILRLVQDHKVSIVVQHMSPEQLQEVDVACANERFLDSYTVSDLMAVMHSIGNPSGVREAGAYRVLAPIQPQPWSHIYPDTLLHHRREAAKKIKNQEQQRHYLEKIEEEKQKLSLGIPLKDMMVRYNPNPFTLLWDLTRSNLRTVQSLILGRLNVQLLSGPIGVIHVLHNGWSIGIGEAFFWIGLISMNLAVLNLLPIPVLDGGYIALCLWEVLTRRRLNMRIVEKILIPFSLLLVGLLIFLTFQDVFRCFWMS